MPKNELAVRFKKIKLDGFNAGVKTAMDLMTVVLNNEFGFGKDRLTKCADAFNRLFLEYGSSLLDVEGNFAKKKLEARIKQIMRE